MADTAADSASLPVVDSDNVSAVCCDSELLTVVLLLLLLVLC